MDKIEKIRQEVEQLRKLLEDHNYYLDNPEQALGYGLALDDIEKFLDTLQAEEDFDDVAHYTKVREIKTGKEFWAEYSTESAEWYEADTGNAYSISDVEIVKEQQEDSYGNTKLNSYRTRNLHPQGRSVGMDKRSKSHTARKCNSKRPCVSRGC